MKKKLFLSGATGKLGSILVKIISNRAINFQSGYLYHYAFVMLIGFSVLLTY